MRPSARASSTPEARLRRAFAHLVIAGVVNLVWAVGTVALIRAGVVSPWLRWIVPIPIVVGLGCIAYAAVWQLQSRRTARALAQTDEAARTLRTAPVTLHAPVSLAALAHDPEHRAIDLLARDDR